MNRKTGRERVLYVGYRRQQTSAVFARSLPRLRCEEFWDGGVDGGLGRSALRTRGGGEAGGVPTRKTGEQSTIT